MGETPWHRMPKSAIVLTPNDDLQTWGYAVWDESRQGFYGLVGFASAEEALRFLTDCRAGRNPYGAGNEQETK